MSVYLDDRRQDRRALACIAADVAAIRREVDRVSGNDVADAAARKSRSSIVRDAALVILAAVLAVAGHSISSVVL